MPKAIDVGTMFLVKSEIGKNKKVTFTSERNCFLQAVTTDDTEQTLKDNNWSYVKHENKFYILGEDAIKLRNLLTIKSSEKDKNLILTEISNLRRPMKDGVLNTGEEKLSIAIIQKIIANLVGPPSYPNEVLAFCVPGDAVDKSLSVSFHRSILINFIKSLGYVAECVPEAVAIIYSERPVAEENGEEVPFSGISLGYGSGMCNVAFCFRKMPLINFSIAKSGDWIDKEAAKIAGNIEIPVLTRFKESKFDLRNIDPGDMKQVALDFFYQEMIKNSLTLFAEKFNKLESHIDVPLEIVVAGGTASVPGFIDKFKQVLSELELPFKVKGVRLADAPLYCVANGLLVKAIATESKMQKDGDKVLDKV